ncbi:MAG: hypothetical protein KAQ94_03220 [Arcobacteraceae bacterium]|nr:hypothetical protein [Arcobacteraceae bacterium]
MIQSTLANNLPIRNQDVSPQQLQKQNKEIVKLAAQAESKDLPQVVNKYTTIVSIEAVDATMVYTFEINTGSKSDEAIINEDHSKMERIVTEGICTSSKRFMDAQITKTYIYKSAISKKKLFQFDVNQAICFKIYGPRYGDN